MIHQIVYGIGVFLLGLLAAIAVLALIGTLWTALTHTPYEPKHDAAPTSGRGQTPDLSFLVCVVLFVLGIGFVFHRIGLLAWALGLLNW